VGHRIAVKGESSRQRLDTEGPCNLEIQSNTQLKIQRTIPFVSLSNMAKQVLTTSKFLANPSQLAVVAAKYSCGAV